MHYLDYTMFRPDTDNCIEVLMSDVAMSNAGTFPHQLKNWCKANTRSFVWMDEVETVDVSVLYDYIYAFYFAEEADANWFKLRWM